MESVSGKRGLMQRVSASWKMYQEQEDGYWEKTVNKRKQPGREFVRKDEEEAEQGIVSGAVPPPDTDYRTCLCRHSQRERA
jgi:hypothetical protein